MRKFLWLGICCVAMSIASAANAEIILYQYDATPMANLSVTQSTVTGTFNGGPYSLTKLVFTLDSWIAPAYSGAAINAYTGTWTTSSQATGLLFDFDLPGDTAMVNTYHSGTKTYTYSAQPAPLSYMSFATENSDANWDDTFAADSAGPVGYMYSSQHGGWYTQGGSTGQYDSYWVSPGMTLATVYVTSIPGTTVTFTAANDHIDGIGTTLGTIAGSFAYTLPVPEPGTLALLAGGLFGLVVYAWRKRK